MAAAPRLQPTPVLTSPKAATYVYFLRGYNFLLSLRRHPYSLEFVYLRRFEREAAAGMSDPYDLEIVPHSEIKESNFYTMSTTGVTHNYNGAVEFTPLDQWEREYHLYNQYLITT
eukprot:1186973-Prorocentrum_minimum.AAC.2